MSEATLAPPTRFAARALTLGTPRFSDARLATLARARGDAAAWKAALAQGAAGAAASADGDFAVGLSDDTGRTFLAVDRFAVRTMCYRVIDGQLHFAARADELAALPPQAAIDPQAIFDYLYFHVIPSPRTVFQGVYRLPPAHCALFEGGRLTVTPYWVPRFSEPGSPEFVPLAAEFRQLVRDAVAKQLDGSKPACFLSGGTDSSTVAGMISEVAGRQAATYSIGFEAEGYDEMQYARIAAKRFGTEHHEYYVTPDDLVRSIPAVAAHYDQPFGNSLGAARVLLRQDGARRRRDQAAGRRRRRRTLRRQRPLRQAARLRLLRRRAGRAAQGLARAPAGTHAAGHAAAGAQGPQLRRAGQGAAARPHADVQPAAAPGHRSNVFTPDFLAQVDPADPLRQQRAVWQQVPAASALNRMLAYDWRYTLAEADLPKVCGSTSLAGMAVGFPFLDQRLGRLLAAAAHRLQAQGAEAALVLQGGAARLSARRDPDEEEAGVRVAVRGVGEPARRPERNSRPTRCIRWARAASCGRRSSTRC